MIKRMECIISGRVQMVMFRDFTTRRARKLGVVGFVHNELDGKVFVCAEGEEEKLEILYEFLQKGSLLSRVDEVQQLFLEPSEEFTKFTIKY